ncbi:MAG: transketolase, partial [Bacteroidetes bacterium]
ALEAKKLLNAQGYKVRVVNMPCTELFDAQDEAYRASVLPEGIRKRVAVEAGATQSWWKYVGLDGKVVGLDRFGASAPWKVLYEKLGLTAERVAEALVD